MNSHRQSLPGTFRLEAAANWRAQSAGRLTVQRGAAWITREGDVADVVLAEGDSLAVAGGERLTIGPLAAGASVDVFWRAEARQQGAAVAALAQAAGRLGRWLQTAVERLSLNQAAVHSV